MKLESGTTTKLGDTEHRREFILSTNYQILSKEPETLEICLKFALISVIFEQTTSWHTIRSHGRLTVGKCGIVWNDWEFGLVKL